ncbi:MAG: large conductance mechanosensitive channel protein MscL [Actinobacteria bacterium]|nr:large conductance mechanosensitive channel protein MscL [Actinomycetota bacterium]
MKMLKEFQEFINRGNVLDLAVAVIIGGAFGQITSSLVDQVIMPVLGLIIGGVDFSNIGFILRDADLYASVNEAVAAGAPVIQIGAFINTIINFLLIAIVLFFIVRSFNNLRTRLERKKEAEEAAPAAPSEDIVLLREIRDLLSKQ